MSTQHTQGAIRYEYDPGYCGEIISSNGHTVATFVDEPSEADARRLVACWNACNGITTERLEDLGRPLMQHLIGADERAGRMVKERDELLESLEALVNEQQPLGIDRPTYQAALKVIDKVATKVKGGTT